MLPILVTAFLARALVRFAYGEEYFWKNSYSLFYDLAQSVAAGRGLCYEWFGTKCAHRPPVYPLFLVLSMTTGKSYVTIVILQSIIGAGTSLCAYLIGTQLFDRKTALLAALGVAVYPYFIMHDTALQETGLFTFLTALAIMLLLKSRLSASKVVWVIAGLVLGLAVLTRTTLVVFVPFAFLWLLFFAGVTRREAITKTAVVALGFMLVLSPWLLRNYFLIGSPTLSTLSGLTLWAGNNPYTFSNYPIGSIDASVGKAWENLPPGDDTAIKQLSNDEIAQNSWFLHKAFGYMKEHPGETVKRSFRKVGAAFSWRQNPARERFVQAAYFLSYLPTLILGIAGAWMSRRRWREHSLIYGLFGSFIIVTAVFFAHTSHRSFLDVFLMVFAANAVCALYRIAKNRELIDRQMAHQ
jgi:4-amino-4-deoxy-L-arabinose transferase-like glycosyltransferase